MYAIYDDQTEDRLSNQESPTVEEAQEDMRTLLTRTREQVEATGDSAESSAWRNVSSALRTAPIDSRPDWRPPRRMTGDRHRHACVHRG